MVLANATENNLNEDALNVLIGAKCVGFYVTLIQECGNIRGGADYSTPLGGIFTTGQCWM